MIDKAGRTPDVESLNRQELGAERQHHRESGGRQAGYLPDKVLPTTTAYISSNMLRHLVTFSLSRCNEVGRSC